MCEHHRIEQHTKMWRFAHDDNNLLKQCFDAGFSRGEPKTLRMAAHLVFNVAPEIDQLGARCQQRM